MIVLVLTIPFIAAQELSVTTYKGEDSTNGYARVVDEITIETLAQVPGENIISEDQMRLYVEDSVTFFDNCTPTGDRGYHNCIFYDPSFEWYEALTFTAELRDDDDNIVGSETKTLVVDNVPPRINISVDPPISSGDITVSYLAEDYALTHGDTTECSGIKTVTITGGETAVQDHGDPGQCIKDNVIEMTLEPGTEQVCAVVTDHVNFESAPHCADIIIDASPPTIETMTITDMFNPNVEITHVRSGQQRMAAVNIRVTDDGQVDSGAVQAKFTDINPNLPDYIPIDDQIGDLFIWKNIPVSEVSNCEVDVKAKDLLGNTAEESFPCDINADDTPPTVTGILPENERDGTPLYGFGTPLTIAFEDKDNTGAPGIGMNSLNAYLDLSELGLSDFTAADSCTHEGGSTWHCNWVLTPSINTPEGSYNVHLLPGTSDDLENTIGSTTSYEIIYDNIGPHPPRIIDFTVVSGESGVEYEGGAVRGDYVQYTLQSKDFDEAFANFSMIGGSGKTTPTTCTPATGNGTTGPQNCVFESLVSVSGPGRADFTFTFLDDAGNKAQNATTLEIYGLDNETNPQYWQLGTIQCTPSTVGGNIATVDRKLASLVSPYITCRAPLNTIRDDITTLSIAGPTYPDECSGNVELNVADVYVSNNAEGSTNPYLFYILEPQDYYVDRLNITCPISILSKREATVGNQTGFYVSPYAQELDVNMSVMFYNNPLGDLYNDVDRQVRDAMNDGFANQEWIGTLRDILAIGEQICNWKVLLNNVITTLTTVTMAFGITAEALSSNPFTAWLAPSVGSTAQTFCTIEEQAAEGYKNFLGWLDYLCSIVNCKAVSGGTEGDIGGYLGGDVPWCRDFKEALNEFDFGLGAAGGMKEAGTQVDVKNSIILSTVCLCLPGIIYNLEKLRQIQCFKATCYYDKVREEGYPTSFCEGMYGYLLCQYAVGQVFSLLPFVQFFDKAMNIVVDLITNPVALFTLVIGGICTETCPSLQKQSEAFFACAIFKTIATAGEAWASFAAMSEAEDMFSPVGNQYCERMQEIKDEIGE